MIPRTKTSKHLFSRSPTFFTGRNYHHHINSSLLQRLFGSQSETNVRPHIFPDISLLNDMSSRLRKAGINMEDTAIVCVQHGLETTGSLFKAILELGVSPKYFWGVGKCYSSSPAVVKSIQNLGIYFNSGSKPLSLGRYHDANQKDIEQMWDDVAEKLSGSNIKRLLVLDDGGRCLEAMPNHLSLQYALSGVEQTRGGLYSKILKHFFFPVVNVAASAVKKNIEASFIATAVLNRLKPLFISAKSTEVCGIGGFGAIGYAIAHALRRLGKPVIVYDDNPQSFGFMQADGHTFKKVNSRKDLILHSDRLFGCSGRDLTEGLDVLSLTTHNKLFISVSSEDKEFLSFLKIIDKSSPLLVDPLSNLIYRTPSGHLITVVNGGFPVNFDRQPWNVPKEDIRITQGLLLGAVAQAHLHSLNLPSAPDKNTNSSIFMLAPSIQQFVMVKCESSRPKEISKDFWKKASDKKWLEENSGGHYQLNPIIDRYLNLAKPVQPKKVETEPEIETEVENVRGTCLLSS